MLLCLEFPLKIPLTCLSADRVKSNPLGAIPLSISPMMVSVIGHFGTSLIKNEAIIVSSKRFICATDEPIIAGNISF